MDVTMTTNLKQRTQSNRGEEMLQGLWIIKMQIDDKQAKYDGWKVALPDTWLQLYVMFDEIFQWWSNLVSDSFKSWVR